MRSWLLRLSVFLCIFLSIFLAPFGSVSATDSLYDLTVEETRQLFGDELAVTLYTSGGYVDYTADYKGSFQYSSHNWLVYYISGSVSVVKDPDYISVDLTPQGSLINTSHCVLGIGVTSSSSGVSSAVYAPSRWEVFVNGVSDITYSSPDDDRGVYPNTVMRFGVDGAFNTSNQNMQVVDVNYEFSENKTFVTSRATFYGCGSKTIVLRCPTIDYDGSFSFGDAWEDGGGGSSEKDYTGVLDSISGWLQSLTGVVTGIPSAVVDGVKGLFVPDDDVFTGFASDVQDMLQDKLGLLWDGGGLVQYVIDAAEDAAEKDTITIPAVSINFGSFTWSMGGNTVSLVPNGFSGIIDVLATIIDILSLFALGNMIKLRVDREVLGGAAE